MTFFEWLIALDKSAMGYIHEHLTTSWLDVLMVIARDPKAWIPLYIFIGYWVIKNIKPQALIFILLTLATFAVCDFTSASIFKPLFNRLRPCYDTDMLGVVHSLVGCGGKYSFPSSHAANHFGLATFWFWAIKITTGKSWYWVWLWATLICFAQVYVGKHFPLDIAGGALLGYTTGILLAKVFERLTTGKQEVSKKKLSFQ